MPTNDIPKITIPHLQAKKENGEKIVALTAYDFPTARLEILWEWLYSAMRTQSL
jgi:hypothetical protein